MPVSGLVLSLTDEVEPRAQTLEALRRERRITEGPLNANRMAIVVETESVEQDKQVWDWLNALQGVTFVELAFVGYDDGEDSPDRSRDMAEASRGPNC